jgi:preprotein translocase subunit Sec61beta
MAKQNKINLPSGGGIIRYFEGSTSSLTFTPQTLVIICVVLIVVMTAIHLMIAGVF